MLSRVLTVPTLLAAAVAVPYVATNAPEWKNRWHAGSQPASAVGAPSSSHWPGGGMGVQPLPGAPWPSSAPGAGTAPLAPTASGVARPPAHAPLEGTPTYSLADVLRLDVTKEWVYQRWARKSTALSELDLYGVRVPLVTGTQVHDLAGSLTYFFTPDGRVQRISFRGRTGDTTQLIALVTQRYGFQWQTPTAAGEQLLQVRRGEEILCELRTRPAPVLWSNSPNDSFSVNLELQDPASGRALKPILAPLPAAVVAAQAANAQAGAAPSGRPAAKSADGKPAEPGWKAFFPRSRTPKEQIKNLDSANMSR